MGRARGCRSTYSTTPARAATPIWTTWSSSTSTATACRTASPAAPPTAGPLTAIQSAGMGEGWSDWWALMLTQLATDTKLGGYTIGTYDLGQPPTGAGFRRHPYSFDVSVDPITLADFAGAATN